MQEYEMNITEFSTRQIKKVWKPKTTEELIQILRECNESSRPVYPISTGHNWGLGSKLPVVNADILDLASLDEIIEVNEELSYARVQPGVTQKMLAEYLKIHHPSLVLNVTGSDAHSSILANALERGSGKNGHRANDIRELEIMCANGDVFRTGLGGLLEGGKPYYKYGLGPDFTHLFTQSNLGIVTEAVINLQVKQPFTLVLTQFSYETLGDFLNTISVLVKKGIVSHSLEVDSQNDPKIFELFEADSPMDYRWVSWFVIFGEEAVRKAKLEIVRKQFADMTDGIRLFDSEEDHSQAAAPIQVRISRYNGMPNDHSLLATAKSFGVELDENNPDIDLAKDLPGFRCVLPVLPFSKSAAPIIELILDFSRDFPFIPAISIIGLDAYALEVFARVHFDRSDQSQIQEAGDWARGLLEILKQSGIFPYRLDVESMQPYLASLSDPLIHLKNTLKNQLDPNAIIAPGRYHLIS